MTEFFDRTFYGNTVGQWLTTFLLILGAIILGRVIYWTISRGLKVLAARSKVKLDDILLDAMEEPVILLLVLIGARLALGRLTLAATWLSWIDGALGLVYALITAWLITRVYDAIHRQYLMPLAARSHGAFDDQILPLIQRGIRIIVWVLAIIVGLNNAGYDVGTVLAGLGIGGLAFALAAQDTVANIFGGVTIFAQKPFLLGDLIEFEGRQYIVKEIGWRATTAEDWNTGYRVTIPNSKFTGGIIANVSAEHGYWWAYTLRLSPDTTASGMEQAMQDIRDALSCHPGIDDHKLRFEALGNYAMEVLVLFHVRSFDDRWQVITDANLELLRRFETHGIRLAAPMQVTVTASTNGSSTNGHAPRVDSRLSD